MRAIATDARIADIAQAGKIRLALCLPQHAKDSTTGELRGIGTGAVAIDIVHALATRIGSSARPHAKTGEYQMAGIEELTALRESLAELRRKEAYVLCDNPSAGIDRLVQIHLAVQAIDAVIEGETTPKLDPDAVVP